MMQTSGYHVGVTQGLILADSTKAAIIISRCEKC